MKPPRTQGPGGEGHDSRRRRPTINDIARMAGVSKKTVSRVINGSPSVRADTRERIDAVIAETGYAPDPQARGLAFRRSFLIGLIYDDPNPQSVVDLQLGLLDGMRGSGFELVIHPCGREDPDLVADIRAFIERQKLFGVILTASISEDERIAGLMEEIGCGYVQVASGSLDAPGHVIETRDRLGGLAAARHLVELGHQRVGFIGGFATSHSSRERRGGLEEGLAEAGLALEPRFIGGGAGGFETGVAEGVKLLALDPRPTAIFAADDEIAAGVLQAARQAGLSVPEDLSVVGFDDFQLASRIWPALTTVRAPTREIGRLAAGTLLGRRDENRDPQGRLPILVIRQSSGPAPN